MRIRVKDTEVEYYSRAKRDGALVRVQGQMWHVQGVTADLVSNPDSIPQFSGSQGEQRQWWVELIEA